MYCGNSNRDFNRDVSLAMQAQHDKGDSCHSETSPYCHSERSEESLKDSNKDVSHFSNAQHDKRENRHSERVQSTTEESHFLDSNRDSSLVSQAQNDNLTSPKLDKTLLESLPTLPPNGWKLKKLGEICEFRRGPFGGSLKKEIFVSNGYKVYEQQHAINNNFEIGYYYITQEKFNSMRSFEVLPNDLIVSCSGTIGKIAIAPENIKKGIINQALLRLRIKSESITSKSLKIILDNLNNPFEEKAHGIALKNVANIETLKQIQIPLPPLEAQQKIVSVIEDIEAKISFLDSNLGNIEKQKKEILKRYLNSDA